MNNGSSDLLKQPGAVACRLPDKKPRWGLFSDPEQILTATAIDKVKSIISRVEKAVRDGKYAAGFISYEAGAAFDSAFPRRDIQGFPLVWFGIYAQSPCPFEPDSSAAGTFRGALRPELLEAEYAAAVNDIRNHIELGDIYQTNYTFRAGSCPAADPEQLFSTLFIKHPVPYAAFVNTGEHRIVSLSPELFLERRGQNIASSPMKGTAPRGGAEFLSKDAKNTAENLMIVDMTRNDLGRICKPGSIHADPLFQVDTYATLHQMISTVHGKLCPGAGFGDILQATFPPASITGAPKIAAMRHIDRLEKSPRKVYTGSIGCLLPGGDFCLNVAIRTLLCSNDAVELGIGSGIVYDSSAEGEWREALLKSRFMAAAQPDFKILETMLWENEHGIKCAEKHLSRSKKSQLHFDRAWNTDAVENALLEAKRRCAAFKAARMRLLIDAQGQAEVEVYPLNHSGWKNSIARLKISEHRVDSRDLFLYHKTTCREIYNREFQAATAADFDEAIFFNERDELTEGAISNIFVKLDETWFTPPVSSGLLPGIWREQTLRELHAIEKRISREELFRAEEIIIGNSVRGGVRGGLGQF